MCFEKLGEVAKILKIDGAIGVDSAFQHCGRVRKPLAREIHICETKYVAHRTIGRSPNRLLKGSNRIFMLIERAVCVPGIPEPSGWRVRLSQQAFELSESLGGFFLIEEAQTEHVAYITQVG